MNKLKITAYILVLTLLIVSCKKNETIDPQYTYWPVVEVDGLQQTIVGQAVTLIVSWPYSSGCDVVDKFEIKKQGNVYSIKALGYYNNVVCTQDAGIKTIEYSFVATTAGLYDLNFENPDGSVVSHPILVQ